MPTTVGVLLAGTRVVASVDSVAGYQRTAAAAEYSGGLRDLAQALGLERDRGAWASFQPSNKGLEESEEAQRKVVDALVKKVLLEVQAIDDSYGSRTVEAAKSVAYQLEGISELRRLPGTTRVERYSHMIAPLLKLHEELTLVSDDSEIIGNARALSALAYAKEEVSRQRARLLAGYYAPSLINPQEIEKFIASRSRMNEFEADFSVEASPANSSLLVTSMIDERVHRAELTKSRAIVLAGDPRYTGRLLPGSNEVKQWFSDNTAVLDLMRKVETKVAGDVVARARVLEDTEQRTAIITSALILLLLLLVLGLTVVIARSMVTPLRRLRAEALEVAGFRLPEVVQRLRVSGDTRTPDIAPISVETTDEIGEVAKAFDEVHRQAVRLAAEESELRSNISAMFVNLSRRTQTLVERQISLIDGLEKGEEDGGRLADLFRLDHLATRMRRNSENLLVLAGHEPPRRRSRPAKLVDVVRASLSEVEDYERVQVKVHRTISVAGSAANDIVHLVAELVENAVQFSPRASRVVVSSSAIEGGGALLAVSDPGIGMTHEELVETNRRLADPPVVDVSVSRRMGLFVVGRLALRHGIRVQLRPQEGGGLVAMVLFPPEILVQEVQPVQTPSWGTEQAVSRDFSAQAPTGGPPVQRPSYGQAQPSFGQSSFGQAQPSFEQSSFGQGQSSFGQSSFGQGSFGQASIPDAPSFGSTSLPGDHTAPGRQDSAGHIDSSGAPAGGAPLPKRQVGGMKGNGGVSAPGSPSRGESSYEHEYEYEYEGPAAGTMPTVGVSPLEPEQEEYLPIFASVESAWFRRADGPGEQKDGPVEDKVPTSSAPVSRSGEPEAAWAEESMPPAGAEAGDPDGWDTPSDVGWQAAQAVSAPTLGGITAAGLPKRIPRANLVPGTAAPTPSSPMPSPSPDRVRNRLTSFQQGVRRGRAEVAEATTGSLMDKEEGS
ncbi:nitrate- and nitrite sensing domain-containing protein [Streptosporangium sp. NBC_01810]|uniref:sensor histidine kinase n=1 Tax=Streptosporangium sp. NBC_01810 TaxID=2975951 RepID=UPI002DD8AE3E|nr:nitrate- and nitrite sensing domain-containing protein [Streptosporangium sp. NBC_01810]WSA23819.1 nitrate- and nitrite sensing domain-containing protein [Streptosporangium sp. NBC_01810]